MGERERKREREREREKESERVTSMRRGCVRYDLTLIFLPFTLNPFNKRSCQSN